MQENRRRFPRRYLPVYTGLFLMCACAIFSWYFFAGRTLIWQADGWEQHYKALVYYARYLRSIARSLFSPAGPVIPHWDFAIGEGGDILQTLHYYVIGDPFTFLSVLVPTRFLPFYYEAMILLRLYLAGLFFSRLCVETGKSDRFALLAGSISYCFCYWCVLNAARHPYFLNPMVYLPLIVLGLERIFAGKRPTLYILAVFVSGLSNFYFFYMLVLVTVIYFFARLISLYRFSLRRWLLPLGRVILFSVIGAAMAGAVLLPVLFTFLGDSRLVTHPAYHLFYLPFHYATLPGLFLSEGSSYWLCMGYAAPVLPAVFLLFRKKGDNGLLKGLFLVCLVIIAIPFLGQVFNGFSYMCNRWCWALALLTSYLLASLWPDLTHPSSQDARYLLLCTSIYSVVCCVFRQSRVDRVFAALALCFLFLLLCFPLQGQDLLPRRAKQWLTLAMVPISLFSSSYFRNAWGGANYAAEGVERRTALTALLQNETLAVAQAAQGNKGFWRYSGHSLTSNAGLLAGLSSTNFYWTNANPAVADFRREMELPEDASFHFYNADDRAALHALQAVRYYALPQGDTLLPYGYTALGEYETGPQNKVWTVASTENVLPLAWGYSTVLPREDWLSLSAVQKQEAMLQAAVVENYAGSLPAARPTLTEQVLPYTAEANSSGVSVLEDRFVVTTANASVTLRFEAVPDSEVYCSLHGLQFDGSSPYELYFGSDEVDPDRLYSREDWDALPSATRENHWRQQLYGRDPVTTVLRFTGANGVSKSFTHGTEDYSWYNDRHDYTVQLGYTEEGFSSLTLSFEKTGVYRFSTLTVSAQPMEHLAGQVAALRAEARVETALGTDTVNASVTANSPHLLCFSIPYSTGWRAELDGQPAVLLRANEENLALELPAGTHQVVLRYRTPFLSAGRWVSIGGLLLFLVTLFWDRLRGPKKAKK